MYVSNDIEERFITDRDNEIIFGNTEVIDGSFERYFYKYNINNKKVSKINQKGIGTCECAIYNSYILNNYIYKCIYG